MANAAATSGYLGKLGFAVGFPAFLDEVQSKDQRYWRAIEYGDSRLMGAAIGGLWGNNAEPRGGLHGTATSLFGEGGGQKFIPFFGDIDGDMARASRAAARYWVKALGNEDPRRLLGHPSHHPLKGEATGGRGPIPWTHGVIKKPIEAHRYFEKGLELFGNPAERELEAVTRAFRSYLNDLKSSSPIKPDTSRGLNRLRAGAGETAEGAAVRSGRRRAEISPRALRTQLGGPQLVFTLSSNYQDLARNALGQFNSVQQELREANRILALELQECVAKALEESIVRKGTSTGKLAQAIRDPRNRFPQ